MKIPARPGKASPGFQKKVFFFENLGVAGQWMGRLGGRFSVRGWGSRRGRKHDSPPAATSVGRDRHETEAEPGFSKKKTLREFFF